MIILSAFYPQGQKKGPGSRAGAKICSAVLLPFKEK